MHPVQYRYAGRVQNECLCINNLTKMNTLHKGTTLYIMPHVLKVSECFENELEAITFDLSIAEDMKTLLSGIDILP